MAFEKARPTFFSSRSLTPRYQIATACSLLSGSGRSVRIRRVVTCAKSEGLNGHAAQKVCSIRRALASMSSPVSPIRRSLRKPPWRFRQTFNVAGGGSPCTPCMRTRSGATCSSWIVSKRVVTSGPRYCGPPIS